MKSLIEEIREALLAFESKRLSETVSKMLRENFDPLEIINTITIVLQEIGKKFEEGEFFLMHLVAAGEIVKKVITEQLEPLMKKAGTKRKTLGRVVIGTVAGDIHDIGKNIVASMLFSAGFDVIDLGVDVPVEEFIKAVEEYKPDILAMSALLSTTLPMQKEVIERLKEKGLREKVKVMVGGAPVTPEWATEIGADGYGEDAIQAVKVARSLVSLRNNLHK
ncbi:MAG: corrinoid protein [Nitrososphaeria archaeon]